MPVSEIKVTIRPRIPLLYMFYPLWIIQSKLGFKLWVPRFLFEIK